MLPFGTELVWQPQKQKQKQKKPVFETAPEDNVVFTYEYAHMHPSRLRVT